MVKGVLSREVTCHHCGSLIDAEIYLESEDQGGQRLDFCSPSCHEYWMTHDRVPSVPPALAKATVDPFTYALELRDGTVIVFMSATLHGEWVHLDELENPSEISAQGKKTRPFTFDRGLDVRLADIVWVADAPWGS
jgi:hypothetical protein